MSDLVLDMCLPRRLAEDVRGAGVSVVHVGEIGMSRCTDAEILEFAKRENKTVVTFDSDFAKLHSRLGGRLPSVIHIREASLSRQELGRIIIDLVTTYENRLSEGAIVSVRGRSVRIRSLPIAR